MEQSDTKALGGPNLLVKYRTLVEEAFKIATREALRMHKAAGNPIASCDEDGQIRILQPSETPVD